MKKRLIALVLAGAMLLGVTGCTKINNGNARELKDYSKYVTLGDYKGMKIEVEKIEVTDEDVQTSINSILKSKGTVTKVKEGVVTKTDTINMDYTGYYINEDGSKGKAFEKGADTDFDYSIGGGFIASLNDQLIGLEVGKETDLICKFPDDYPNSDELAGKEVIFTVTVNYIHGEMILPEWNDEFVKTYTEGKYSLAADYEAYIRSTLEQTAKDQMDENYAGLVWTKVCENAKVSDYDETELKEYKDMYYNNILYYIQYYAMMLGYSDYKDFIGSPNCYYYFGVKSEEDLNKMSEDYAKMWCEYTMIAAEISKKENITVPKKEYESEVASMVAAGSYETEEKFEESLPHDFYFLQLIYDKVNAWVIENNTRVLVDKVETTEAATESK